MSDGEPSPVVDVHCHVWTPECADLVRSSYRVGLEPFDAFGGVSTEYNRAHFPQIADQLADPHRRLEDMDRMGVDVQAISVAPPQYYYWTHPRLGARLARLQNDRLAELCRRWPHRFVGLGTVPLQDVDLALREIDYVTGELGFTGLEICTNVAGDDLDADRLRPFWQRVADLDLLILLHPHGFTQGQRLTDFYLINVIGNPLDSTVAVSRLIFSGVVARHPDLKLVIVHGGGYLPAYAARMDHAWRVRPECRIHIDQPPSTYLRAMHFDTVVFDPAHIERLVGEYGSDHVLLGTDYPYDMGEADPVGLLTALDDQARVHVLGANATRLLRLTGPGRSNPGV